MKKLFLWFTLWFLLVASGGRTAPQSNATTAQSAVDYGAVKQSLRVFEGVVDTLLKNSFDRPFFLLEPTKGVYLGSYGVIFAFEVNIDPMRPPNPFEETKLPLAEARRQRDARLLKLKEVMVKALADHSHAVEGVAADGNLAVAAHLFDPAYSIDPIGLKTIIARATRRQVLDLKGGRISAEEFKKKVEWVQY